MSIIITIIILILFLILVVIDVKCYAIAKYPERTKYGHYFLSGIIALWKEGRG